VFLILPISAYRPIQITTRFEQKRLVKIRSAPSGRDTPTGGSGQTQKKTHRAAQACESCKKSRVKCDEAIPSCGGCKKKGIEWRYPDSLPTR